MFLNLNKYSTQVTNNKFSLRCSKNLKIAPSPKLLAELTFIGLIGSRFEFFAS